MKRQVLTAITMLGLFLTLAVVSIQAQSRTKIEAAIPFDFTVGNTNLKAGKYSLRFMSHSALLLRSDNGKNSIIITALRAVGGQVNKPERLVFHRYGEQYFLAQIWMLRGDSGRQLDPSSAERRLTKTPLGRAKPELREITAVAR